MVDIINRHEASQCGFPNSLKLPEYSFCIILVKKQNRSSDIVLFQIEIIFFSIFDWHAIILLVSDRLMNLVIHIDSARKGIVTPLTILHAFHIS